MLNPDILIVDANSSGYSSMYQPNLSRLTFNGKSTGAIHGTLASLFSRMEEYPDALPLVVWDGRAQWRKELLPEYKENRTDTPEKREIREAYRKQVPIVQMLLMYLGIPQVRSGSAEADDVAGVVCRGLSTELRIELDSKDTDWWQALAENVWWYTPLNKTILTLDDLRDPATTRPDGHFLSTDEYVRCKALAGDKSDCIPGVNKVGLKTAAKFLRQYGSMEEMWRQVDAGETKVKGAIMEALVAPETRELYARNLLLMDWTRAPALETWDLAAFCMPPDYVAFEHEALEYGLTRIISTAKKQAANRERWMSKWLLVVNALGL